MQVARSIQIEVMALPLPDAPLLVVLWLLAPVAVVPELDELQIVSLFGAFRVGPETDELSRARPCVTLLKFRRTSPIEADSRVTGLAGVRLALCCVCPIAALRGAENPAFGTGTRSIVDARGLPCSIGWKLPDPLSESPALP